MKIPSHNPFIASLRASIRIVALPIAILAPATGLHAASLQWDANGVAPLGGAGNWDATNLRWYNGSTYEAWVNASNHDAVFNTTAGAVVVDAGGVTAKSLQFDTIGYALSGGAITLAGGTGIINVNLTSAQIATITSSIGGSTGLTKTGNGILSLGAAAAYTGNTAINGGIVRLEVANGLNTAGTLDIASGATFQTYRGNGGNTTGNERYSQALAGLTGSGTLGFGQAATQLTNTLTLNVGSGSPLTFSGSITTSATGSSRKVAIVKAGAGTQVWSPTVGSIFGTELKVNAGTFKLGTTNAIGFITLTGNAAGTLDLNGQSIAFEVTASAVITNSSATLSTISPMFHNKGWSSPIQGNIRIKAVTGYDTTLSSTSNSFTGGVDLTSAGAFVISNALNIPANNQIDFAGGRLDFSSNTMTLDSTRTYTVGAGTSEFRYKENLNATLTLQGAINNAVSPGTLAFGTHPSNPGNSTYAVSGGGNFTGTFQIGNTSGILVNTTTLRMAADNGLAQGATVTFAGIAGETSTLNLNNFNQQIAGLSNTATGYTARVINADANALKTLTVNNTVDNSFNGKLGDTGNNKFGLTKTGAGALILSGSHTYTGATLVSDGPLGGSCSIGGGLTVNSSGTIAPGVTTGTFSVGGNTVVAGTYACDVNGADSDTLAVTGDLDLTNSTLAVTAVSPSASSYTIATYTGNRTGTFTPSPALPSGYTLDYSTANQIKLVNGAISAYDSFASVIPNAADRDPEDDPDADGISNLMEFVLGGSPITSTQDILPTQVIDANNIVLSYTRTDASELAPATSSVGQYSTDLVNWTNVTPVLLNENGSAADSMTVTVPRSNEFNGKLFVRIKVVK